MIAIACSLLLAVLLLASPVHADQKFDAFKAVDLLDRSGAQVPLDAEFRKHDGQAVRLGDLLDGRPAILAPVYFRCPNVCSVTLANLMNGLSAVPLAPGDDYTVIAYSIDDREGPAAARKAKQEALQRLDRSANSAAFRFLTGDANSIARVSKAIGFRYTRNEQTGRFEHAVAVATLTPAGRVSRWLYGLNYQPSDLRLALLEAGSGSIGGIGDKLLLLCNRYDPTTGAYSSIVQPMLMTGAGLTLVLLAAFVGTSLWRERTRRRQ